jgi:osmotically-inducible protein OsmY
MAACAGSSTSESTGEYVDDSVISNKVRADIVGDKALSLFQIDVETFKGTVQLSGFVDTAATKARAGEVAAGVRGVKRVQNNLIVK